MKNIRKGKYMDIYKLLLTVQNNNCNVRCSIKTM